MTPESTSETDRGSASHPTFEELKTLRAFAWDGFSQRREFEWRVALGLWTALAAFASIILGKDVTVHGNAPAICVAVASIVLFAMHIYFVRGIVRGNKVDRVVANYYEDQMRRIAGVVLPRNLHEVEAAHRFTIGLRSYAHVFQLGVTFVLGSAATLAVLWKSLQ